MKFTVLFALLLLTATFTVVQSFDCDDYVSECQNVSESQKGSACWYHNIFYNGWAKREDKCKHNPERSHFDFWFGRCYCCPPRDNFFN
ncbi:hypothetical protein PFISCL1PPCAC_1168 [Pristionchus fissidentatus]|uniref:Uncharacterized protein n=1 Tax=Pristionchus fissidentatus TaxID=1538716 RepID=A0AAV5URW6_9BILA|nr:hypothetical protein PFISCL1PPCAC_1168 [Pristionchus fissidentatus]